MFLHIRQKQLLACGPSIGAWAAKPRVAVCLLLSLSVLAGCGLERAAAMRPVEHALTFPPDHPYASIAGRITDPAAGASDDLNSRGSIYCGNTDDLRRH